MTDLFLYGRLRDAQMRQAVFGADIPVRDGRRALGRLTCHSGAAALVAGDGPVDGVFVDLEIAPSALARADTWAAIHDQHRRVVTSADGAGPVTLYSPKDTADPGLEFCWTEWQAARAPLDRVLARELLALWPERPVEELRRRRSQIAVRAQARLNAETGAGPATLRHQAMPEDVTIRSRRQPYANFFSVEEMDLTHTTFAGGQSAPLQRAAFLSGDAVVVLPYDPVRDRVLLVEQFRMGPYARGDSQPWSLEAVAGRIDPYETPQSTARREAVEEAGLTLGRLIALGGCYPSPGAKAEYLYNFVALTDLPDGAAGHGGLEAEGEDIRSHILPFDRMIELIASGEINNGPLMLIAFQLDRLRAELRRQTTV